MTETSRRSRIPLVAALVLLFVAVAGYGAWRYLAGGAAPEQASRPVARPQQRPTTTPPTGTIVEDAPVAAPEPTAATTTASVETASAAPVVVSPSPVEQPATPTTVAVTPPDANDAERGRIEAMARDYATESASAAFAVQIAFLCEVRSVRTAVESGGAAVWFVPVERGGRTCFRVFHGRYANRSDAQRGVSEVPQPYRSTRPVVVRVADVVKR